MACWRGLGGGQGVMWRSPMSRVSISMLVKLCDNVVVLFACSEPGGITHCCGVFGVARGAGAIAWGSCLVARPIAWGSWL